MTALVIAEHDNASVKGATLNTVTAALACGGDVHVLVAGENAAGAAQAAAQIVGVAKVLHADDAGFAHALGVGFTFDDVGVHHRCLRHAQHWVVVEVALLYATLVDGDFAKHGS